MEFHQKIKIQKDGNHQHIYYENDNQRYYRELNDQEFNNLFEQLRPNVEFSVPDKIIQRFVKDGTLLPSYKTSPNFTNGDFNDMIENIKKDFDEEKHIIERRRENKKNARRNIKRKTKKNKKKTKQQKLKEAVMKKMNIKQDKTKNKNKKNKTNKKNNNK